MAAFFYDNVKSAFLECRCKPLFVSAYYCHRACFAFKGKLVCSSVAKGADIYARVCAGYEYSRFCRVALCAKLALPASPVTLFYLLRRAEPCIVAGCTAQKYPAKVRAFPCFEGFVIKACPLFCYAVNTAFFGAGENISNCHFVHCHCTRLVSADNSCTAKSFH